MKKIAFFLTAIATLVSSTGHAQTPTRAAQAGSSSGMSSGFAWTAAVVGVAVIAAVAAGTGAASGRSPNSFGH